MRTWENWVPKKRSIGSRIGNPGGFLESILRIRLVGYGAICILGHCPSMTVSDWLSGRASRIDAWLCARWIERVKGQGGPFDQ